MKKPAYIYKAFVEKVIDGDTLCVRLDLGDDVLRRKNLRLFGVNCPEIHSKDEAIKERGLKAKARVIELLEGKDVIVETIKDKSEKFGRLLGKVYLPKSDETINDLLVKEGHAKEYFGIGDKNNFV
jgi:micrococcal nuclease